MIISTIIGPAKYYIAPILEEAGVINSSLAKTLLNMVGFRNIAVHDYEALEVEMLEAILEKHIDDFNDFTKVILKLNME